MFDHVTIRVADRRAAELFYDTVLPTLGIEKEHSGQQLAEWGVFSLSPAHDEKPPTRGLHIGTDAGHRDVGAPGTRPQYTEDDYGSFLLDPDGNSAEAVHHGSMRGTGAIDHLWIGGGSFSFVAGRPSENVHMAFRGPAPGIQLDPDGNTVEIVS